MTELTIGAIIEIRTAKGLAYAQYTHHHPACGEVLWVAPGLYGNRPDDLAALIEGKGGFAVMMPVKAALRRADARLAIMAWAPVPGFLQSFPTFRMAVRNRHGDVIYWWLWDGATVWHQTKLTDEQQQLPLRSISSLEELIAGLDCSESR